MTRWGWLALVLASCPPPQPDRVLDLWTAGCDYVGETCAIAADAPGPVSLWVDAAGPVEVRVGDRLVATSPRPVDGGLSLDVEVSPAELPAVLVVHQPGAGGRATLSLSVRSELPSVPPEACAAEPPQERLTRAVYEATCARAAVKTARDDAERMAAEKARASGIMSAVAIYEELGWTSDAARLRAEAAFYSWLDGDTARGLEILDGIEPGSDAVARWNRDQARSGLLRHVGRLDRAMEAVRSMERVARRVRLTPAYAEATLVVRADLAAELGDLDAARDAYLAAVEGHPQTGACDRDGAVHRENLAWFELQRRQAGLPPTAVEPRALLEEAEKGYLRCASGPTDVASVRINRAIGALLDSDWDAVLALTHDASADVRPELGAWRSALRARAHAARGEGRLARAEVDRAVELASEAGELDAVVHARLTQAEIAVSEGRDDEAESALMAAHDLLFDSLYDLPGAADRAAVLGMHLRVAPRVLELLLELQIADGRAADALAAFRRARVAALRSLRQGHEVLALDPDTRERWQAARARHDEVRLQLSSERQGNWSLSGEELARAEAEQAGLRAQADTALAEALSILGEQPEAALRDPDAGEVLLAFVPIDGRWVGLLAEAGTTRTFGGPSTDVHGDSLARALMESLAGELGEGSTVERVVLLPWGELVELDLHVLPLPGDPEVVWSVDLGAAPPAEGAGALVVGDPDGTLPNAREEAARFADEPHLRRLVGEQATLEAVLGALPEVERFHFAGHGQLDAQQSWRSGLILAHEDVLDVADILALPQAPRMVVLSGCETGRTTTDQRVASLGIAQALLMAGSEVVVASSRPVGDESASARVGTLLHGTTEPDAVVRRLHALQRASDTADAAAWRAWVR